MKLTLNHRIDLHYVFQLFDQLHLREEESAFHLVSFNENILPSKESHILFTRTLFTSKAYFNLR